MQIIVQKKYTLQKNTVKSGPIESNNIWKIRSQSILHIIITAISNPNRQKKINITKHEVCLGMICDGKRK